MKQSSLLILAFAFLSLFISIPTAHGANCSTVGLPVDSGTIPAGTYDMTGDCIITGTLVIDDVVTINGNGFAIDGANGFAIFTVQLTGDLTLNNVAVQNGLSSVGGINNVGGTVTISNSTISGNSGTVGGINNGGGTVTISNSTISGNSGTVGGINNSGGTLTISNSTISGNTGTTGGINNSGGTLTISNSTISGNTGTVGGISNDASGTVTISNSTISGNTGTVGGIGNGAGTVTISNSTISGNSGSVGGIINLGGTVTISNSIVSGNTPDNCDGTITDAGGNMENGSTCGFAVGNGSFPNTDPLLGAFNGAYYPLLTGSPAIDAVACSAASDQIGTARPQGTACDIGAIEMPATVTTDTGQPQIIQAAPPMCNTVSDIDAPGLPDGVYCRILMQNNAWRTNAGTVPQNLIDAGVILAVDVFRITGEGVTITDFGGYVQICLPGEGRLIFLDATGSPRPQIELSTESASGSTCGWIPNAGTVVLIQPGE